jgi:type 1 glutamine amidotransferase
MAKHTSRRCLLKALTAAPLLAPAAAQNPAPAKRDPGNPVPAPHAGLQGWDEDPPHTRKILFAWGDNRNVGKGHTSISHAMSVIERIGYESGLWDTYIRSDSDMITLRSNAGASGLQGGPLTLREADAIFFIGHRNIALTPDQKADLLTFVRDEGKGFVAAHTALTAFSDTWPEFTDMLGGYFAGHPWEGHSAVGHIVNEDPNFPATRHFPAEFTFDDEYYMVRHFNRAKSRVVLRLDVSKLPPRHAYNGPDNDFPVAWAKMYGKGHVFYSSFAHSLAGWDNSEVQRMYLEAIRWSMGLGNPDLTPRPVPANQRPPSTAPVPEAAADLRR